METHNNVVYKNAHEENDITILKYWLFWIIITTGTDIRHLLLKPLTKPLDRSYLNTLIAIL